MGRAVLHELAVEVRLQSAPLGEVVRAEVRLDPRAERTEEVEPSAPS